ncbi:tyrosine-type recombinase/integrase [Olivibacter sp. SDN3]|uniref:tyrosine-type recombinase/integrase n=1 Tax=Olivibacter sp. SDN3 TaxID=2764720 RepID=UPI0016519AEF|nr:tyrosine-type recombinase/integrase [Olivibacter sp. SDN3]QNL47696.1 tyrosine-type recombinase/integrase [Olivibacter sp. SDN3]
MYLDKFISFLTFEKRYSAHTVKAYEKDISMYLEFWKMEGIGFDELTHKDVRFYLSGLMENKLGASSVNRILSSLRTYYKFLQREGLHEENPMLLLKAVKTPKKLPVVVEEGKMDVLLADDVFFAKNFEGIRDRLIIELLFGTGMRLSELVHLKEEDVDLYQRTIRILGKRNKERIVPLLEGLEKLISAYLLSKKNEKFDNNCLTLVVTKKGKPVYPGLVYRVVTNYLSLITSQQKKSPHVLRHSFATALLNRGADLNAIKELLGHANLVATQVYTHNSVERLKSIYKQAHPKA